ncbi:hypothetical protein CRI93_02580 [Longimonas halophila]|uniref:KAP NTPase domain-containing protein n=2 Tax=Longimonas halophila TaxID=1469170 RepID=A0A2H3P9M7_9BACT|nr:hypothetical protein CRI93_02580 [Longimonas halophila]
MSDSKDQDYNRSDTPISSIEEDQLGRDTFAIQIANSIRNLPGTDGMVIGVEGGWGEGKTSVLNMIREALEEDIEKLDDLPANQPKRDGTEPGWLCRKFRQFRAWSSQYFFWNSGVQERLQVVAFEPWQLTGVETITRSMFQDMGRAIGHSDISPETERLAQRMEQLAIAFGVAEHTKSNNMLAGWVRIVLGLVSLVGVGFSLDWLKLEALIEQEVMTRIFAGIASLLGLIASFFGGVSKILRAESEIQSKTTENLREDVRTELKRRKHPLVVIIDDVDRLASDEVLLLFKLVRANGRFPNVVYLLGFDGRQIAEMFKKENVDEKYIDKIVQEIYRLPSVPEGKIKRYAKRKVLSNELLGNPVVDQSFVADDRWGWVFKTASDAYFHTRRDVNRFIGSLRLQIGRFVRDQKFEANPVDLFALHVLRHFESAVFERLLANKILLCEALDGNIANIERFIKSKEKDSFQSQKAVREQKLDIILDKSKNSAVKQLLSALFPHAGNALHSREMVFNPLTWVRNRRIAHPFFFRSYFEQPPSPLPLTRLEEEQLRSAVSNKDSLFEALVGYQDQDEKRLLEALHFARECLYGGVFSDYEQDNILRAFAKLELIFLDCKGKRNTDLDLINEPATAVKTAEDMVEKIVSESKSDQQHQERIELLIEPYRAFRFAGREIERAEEENSLESGRLQTVKRKYADQIWSRLEGFRPGVKGGIDDREDFAEILLRFFRWDTDPRATAWLEGLVAEGNMYAVADHFCQSIGEDTESARLDCDLDFLKILDGTLSANDLRDQVLEAAEETFSSESSASVRERQVMSAVKRLIESS